MQYEYLAAAISNSTSAIKPFDRYEISASEVAVAEAEIGKSFPIELKAFWREIGGGFIRSSIREGASVIDDSLSFQSPLTISEEMRAFPERFAEAMPFFDLSDDIWFVILSDGRIAWDDDHTNIVSENLADFVTKVFDDPMFWMDQSPQDEPKG